VLWSSFDLEFSTSDEYSCDLLVTDEREGVEVYRVWEAKDDHSMLVVEDAAEEAVLDYLQEQDGWEDAVWASEAERTRVKYAVKEVREETVFYLEEPPRDAYEDIGRLEALEILDQRGIEPDNLEDAWYWPQKNKAAFHFVSVDSHGETYQTLREVANLDDVERGLVAGRWPDEEDSRKSIEELQEEIYEKTTWAEFESGIIACWRRGITDYEEIADALDSNYQTVTNSVYHIRDKLEMRAREQRDVYPAVPENFRPDDLLFQRE